MYGGRQSPSATRGRSTTPIRPPADNKFHLIATMGHSHDSTPHLGSPSEAPLYPCVHCGIFATRGHQIKCSKRPVSCPDCDLPELTAASLAAHSATCPNAKVPCPGCRTMIARVSLRGHISSQCQARRFTCEGCQQGFWIAEEYVVHAYPRCKAGVVNCQLCNELVSGAFLAQHYAMCAQRNLRSDVSTATHPRRSGSTSTSTKFVEKSPKPANHHKANDTLHTGKARAHSTSIIKRVKDSLVARQGSPTNYMSPTRSSYSRVGLGEPASPIYQRALYVDKPLVNLHSRSRPAPRTPRTANKKPPQLADASLNPPSSGTISPIPITHEGAKESFHENEAHTWLSSSEQPKPFDTYGSPHENSYLDTNEELTGFADVPMKEEEHTSGGHTKSTATIHVVHQQPLPLSPSKVAEQQQRGVSPNRRAKDQQGGQDREVNIQKGQSNSPVRSQWQSRTNGKQIHIPKLSLPTANDRTVDHNITSVDTSPRRRLADSMENSGLALHKSSSRHQLLEAMDTKLLPRTAHSPRDRAVEELPLSHSPSRTPGTSSHGAGQHGPSIELEDQEPSHPFLVASLPLPHSGGIPRSISPHHMFNSYHHRQQLHRHQQSSSSILGTSPYTAVRTTPKKNQHMLTRPLGAATTEAQLKADPRFGNLSKVQQEAMLKDFNLRAMALKSREDAKRRAADDLHSPQQNNTTSHGQREALALASSTSSGAMRRSITPPARSQGGRPFRL